MDGQLVNPYQAAGATAPAGLDRDRYGTGLLARIASWIEQEWRFRQTRNELSRLSDRELADIGLYRIDIEAVARRAVGA